MIKFVLLTGGTGFLGKIISNSLSTYNVSTLGRHHFNTFSADLTAEVPVIKAHFDLVIHCAGKAHIVPKTVEERQSFYEVNVNGTKNLLSALEKSENLPKYFILISSVAVYGRETGSMINEDSALLAKDPYGQSKIWAEKLVREWCSEHDVICTILRPPLIIGSNPPGNLNAMIKGISKGYYFDIAGGRARKSMVLAKDIAKIITKVAPIGGIYNLTDREHPSFSELSLNISIQLGKSRPLNIPSWIALIMAKIGDVLGTYAPINSEKVKKITKDLTFDDQRAVDTIGWSPTPVLKEFKI